MASKDIKIVVVEIDGTDVNEGEEYLLHSEDCNFTDPNFFQTKAQAAIVQANKRVAISSDDNSPSYLFDKVVVGSTKLTKAETNPSGNELLTLDLGTVLIDDLSDVDTTTTPPATDDRLKWVSPNWIPSNFAADVRATILTGLSLVTGGIIAATDSILVALGKLQYQITNFKNDTFAIYSTLLFQTNSTIPILITSFRITPNIAGMYEGIAVLTVAVNSNSDRNVTAIIYKNGIAVPNTHMDINTTKSGAYVIISCIFEGVDMNGTTDYLEVWVSTSSNTLSVNSRNFIITREGP